MPYEYESRKGEVEAVARVIARAMGLDPDAPAAPGSDIPVWHSYGKLRARLCSLPKGCDRKRCSAELPCKNIGRARCCWHDQMAFRFFKLQGCLPTAYALTLRRGFRRVPPSAKTKLHQQR